MGNDRRIEILSRVTFSGALSLSDRGILTPAAIEFLALLQIQFGDRRKKLIARRTVVQKGIDMGTLPSFDQSYDSIRSRPWTVRETPADLADRRIEIVVPAGDPAAVVEAMNCGANVCVIDFEDSLSPGWEAVLAGQRATRDAARRELCAHTPSGRRCVHPASATALMVRPRGWHLLEKHFCVDGEPLSASLFDTGLFLWHNARELLGRGSGPYLSVPKLENRYEAALWNDVLGFAERHLELPHGSIRVSALIETFHAAFEMDEILYDLRERSVGLAADHSDALFSFVKTFAWNRGCILPEPGCPGRGTGFLDAVDALLVQTCHRRGASAIGAAPAAVPPSNDPAAREAVRTRLQGEVLEDIRLGFDGTAVAYPAMVKAAREVYHDFLPAGHQRGRSRNDLTITTDDLLSIPQGPPSEAGLRDGIGVAVRYLESWLSGTGSLTLCGRFQDAAGAELARAGVWQWISHGVRLAEGTLLTPQLFRRVFTEEMGRISDSVGPERYRRGQFELASRLFLNIVHDPEFAPFMTPRAYQHL